MHTTASRTFAAVVLLSLATTAIAQQQGRPGGRQGSGPPTPEQFVERMMSNDANGDGKLSRDEIPGRFAERIFDANDANGDGFLDAAELKTAATGFISQRGNRPDRAGAPGQVRPGAPADAIDRPGPPRGAGPGGKPLDFEGGMKQAGRALRSLRRSSFDAASMENDLENIGLIQQGLMAAKMQMMTAPMAEQAEARFGDDKAAYRAEFRMTLVQTLMESLALEMAIVEGDAEAAKNSLAHLLENRKEAHNDFQPEDEDDEDELDTPAPTRVQPNRNRRPAGSN
ncbi:MAG: hypothetical protein Q9O74_02185 [Planctomycetota bacterium]|nr:hypothetical protein [Planctomycetota bacterium]